MNVQRSGILPFITLILIMVPLVLPAQILNDSIQRGKYGYHTTKYILEEDLLNNQLTFYTEDSTTEGIQNYDYRYHNGMPYQDLGNLGTPLNPVFYQMPDRPGAALGEDIFDPYKYQSSDVRYYDTRSAYTDLLYTQGTQGQRKIRVGFARNITPFWNAGFNYRRIASDQQLSQSVEDINQTDHHSFVFHTRFLSPNGRYQLLAHFNHNSFLSRENGGVQQDSGVSRNELFDYELEEVRLNDALNNETENKYHLYQQVSLADTNHLERYQLFHVFDRVKTRSRFEDARIDSTETLYPGTRFNDNRTYQRNVYHLFENRFGLKGTLNNFYYRLYYRRKDFSYGGTYFSDGYHTEEFSGLNMRYAFADSSRVVTASGEYLWNDAYQYNLGYKGKALQSGFEYISNTPSLNTKWHVGNHMRWKTDFANHKTAHAFLKGDVDGEGWSVSPAFHYYRHKDFIYFDEDARPAQEKAPVHHYSARVNANVEANPIGGMLDARFNKVKGKDVLRMPEWYLRGKLIYKNLIFDESMHTRIGLQADWRSSYYAPDYMPVTRKFHLQNDFNVEHYLVGTVFLNFRIRSVRVFLRISHINQDLTAPGYFSTPLYPGMRRSFEFGINWEFFS